MASVIMETTDSLTEDVWSEQYEPFKKASTLIWQIGNPTVCAFGFFGNFMITLIMLRLPASPSSVFFQLLAWSDQLVLITNPLCDWISGSFDNPFINSLGSWQCKVHKMTVYTTGALSPWMLVALTMLRAASVLWPLRVNAVWTKGMSRAAAAVLTIVIILGNCHYLYGFDIGSCPFICCYDAVSEVYSWFYNVIGRWMIIISSSVVPFILLMFSNGILLWTLVRSVRAGTHLPVHQATKDSRQRKVSSLTVTLIAAGVSFILLTTPVSVYMVTIPYVDWDDPVQKGQHDVLRAVGHIMWYSNSAINFYLYCLTGAKFRVEFHNIIVQFGGFVCRTRTKPVVKTDSTLNDDDVI